MLLSSLQGIPLPIFVSRFMAFCAVVHQTMAAHWSSFHIHQPLKTVPLPAIVCISPTAF